MAQINDKPHKLKDGRTVIIRTAKESDAKAYLQLANAIMDEQIYSCTQSEELNFTVEQEQAWLKSHFENPNYINLVAEVNGQIVGQLDFQNGHRRRIAHTGQFGMGIDKGFREMGIGSLLLKALIEWAKENPEIEKINLCVHHDNARAIAAYQKQGFQIEGRRTKDLKYPNGVYVDTILMGLNV